MLVAATDNDAEPFRQTLAAAGWLVIDGATCTPTATAVLVTEVHALLITQS